MQSKPNTLASLIKKNLSQIRELCRKHKILRLWVFGSATTNLFREDSDIDILHEWDEASISEEEWLDNHDKFIDSLKQVFNRKIDFVHYPSLKNPYFIEEVDETKVLLYDKEREKVSI